MKITLEMSGEVLRRARAMAAEQGIPLRRFITAAVEEKLSSSTAGEERPWLRMVGGLEHLHEETRRISRLIDEEFGSIEREDRL